MERKNLIYIFADQWRRSAVGFEGFEAVKTPNFDEFALENVSAENAVSACPLCSPYRASFFTGKHPINTGVFTNCKPQLAIHIQDEDICIGDVLKEQGYRTGYIGKWHLDVPEERTHAFPESGAKRWDAFTPQGKGRHGFDFWYSYGAWDAHLHQHYWKDTPEKVFAEAWSPEHETNVAFDFLSKQKADQPFALFLSWNPPHPPYDQVPQKYLDMYEDDFPLKENSDISGFTSHTPEADGEKKSELENRRTIKEYYAAITGIDEQFGRIVKFLKDHDLFEDTYIVVTADHGDMMGAHGMVGKHVWFEESVGIPFLMSGPKLGTGRCKSVISTPDLMPTLLDLLDVSIPTTVEGESCAKNLIDFTITEEKRAYLGCYPGLGHYLEEFSKTELNVVDFGWRAIRSQTHMFVIELGYHPVEHPVPTFYLYDLLDDPLQMEPAVVTIKDNKKAKEMYDELLLFLKEQGDGIMKYIGENYE